MAPMMFGDGDTGMSFVCQRCKQPLRLDESLADLQPSTYDMISSSLSTAHPPGADPDRIARLPPAARQAYAQASTSAARAQVPIHRRVVAQRPNAGSRRGGFGAPGDSFVVLSDSTIGAARAHHAPPPSVVNGVKFEDTQGDSSNSAANLAAAQSQRLTRLSRLFDLLSAHSDVDHPLCTECVDILLDSMTEQLQEAKQDRDRYAGFERELAKDREGEVETVADIAHEIEKLKSAESKVMDELKTTEHERETLLHEMVSIDLEERELEEQEDEFWRDYNRHQVEVDQFEKEYASTLARYHHDLRELKKLQRADVYSDAFCIGYEGGIATINGLRLGKLPGVPVEWVEINAAWGHVALLLQTIARRIDFTFDGLRIVPLGSFSRIERTKGDKSRLELYGSDDFAIARVLHNRRFDTAMVEFLECLRQITDHAVEQNPEFKRKLYHRINKDKIGDVSIKLSFSAEEAWTRALKHVLLTLKSLNANT